jgi:hypothetical protein
MGGEAGGVGWATVSDGGDGGGDGDGARPVPLPFLHASPSSQPPRSPRGLCPEKQDWHPRRTSAGAESPPAAPRAPLGGDPCARAAPRRGGSGRPRIPCPERPRPPPAPPSPRGPATARSLTPALGPAARDKGCAAAAPPAAP